jgi:DNA modification methylase
MMIFVKGIWRVKMNRKAKSGIVVGNCLEVLKQLPDKRVQCVVTSPPYWGLRDYGTATWEGGDPECDHKQTTARTDGGRVNTQGFHGSASANSDKGAMYYRDTCPKCGAIRIDNQLGLEKTPEEYVAKMVDIFREIRRVLRDDGTVWLNLGDSYAGNMTRASKGGRAGYGTEREGVFDRMPQGLKPKDLVGIPWRVAFALQADGWWLRQDVIWHKLNPMPSSVTDRCVTSHEYIFLLTKKKKYFFDSEAIKEEAVNAGEVISLGAKSFSKGQAAGKGVQPSGNGLEDSYTVTSKRNKRNVWSVSTKPFKGAHFAVFPEDLILPCVLAGTSERGCCPKCGSPWERIIEKKKIHRNDLDPSDPRFRPNRYIENKYADELRKGYECGTYSESKTVGWEPTCECQSKNLQEKGQTVHTMHKNRADGLGEPDTQSKTVGWKPTCKCQTEIERITRKDVLLTLEDSTLVLWLEKGNGEYRITVEGEKHHNNWTKQTTPNGRQGHFERKGYSIFYWGVQSETVGWKPTCDCESPPGEKYKNQKSYGGSGSSFKGHSGHLKANGEPINPETVTIGFKPTCDCTTPYEPIPCLVLDPFSGAGTTWVVSKKLGRMFWGIELNDEYAEMARNRVLTVEEGIGYPVIRKLPDEAKFLLAISGIGQKTALAIWDHFNNNIYRIVTANQKELIEVSGVGKKSATDIIFGLRGYKEDDIET